MAGQEIKAAAVKENLGLKHSRFQELSGGRRNGAAVSGCASKNNIQPIEKYFSPPPENIEESLTIQPIEG